MPFIFFPMMLFFNNDVPKIKSDVCHGKLPPSIMLLRIPFFAADSRFLMITGFSSPSRRPGFWDALVALNLHRFRSITPGFIRTFCLA